ncbi:MAG: NAD-dependent epimerase/dehydratase family protein, partial [Deltaproteobacteria bacterium]|nr:NAD-dependent epimerase/dehydratase family protein [Deltaproteobacteria bacterium]
MPVLVTGGCGLIGSMLTRMLAEKDEKVYAMDINLRPERFSGVTGSLTVFKGDVGNFAKVLEAV